MQNHLNKLNAKTFRYCGLLYRVVETKIMNYKAVIKTDRQTFVKTQSELDAFMDGLEFLGVDESASIGKSFIDSGLVPTTECKPSNEMVAQPSPLQTEIVYAQSNASKVSDKLMEVFNLLSDSPTEETYKKAQAMVNVSNSIVNVQMAQIKFLTLKK